MRTRARSQEGPARISQSGDKRLAVLVRALAVALVVPFLVGVTHVDAGGTRSFSVKRGWMIVGAPSGGESLQIDLRGYNRYLGYSTTVTVEAALDATPSISGNPAPHDVFNEFAILPARDAARIRRMAPVPKRYAGVTLRKAGLLVAWLRESVPRSGRIPTIGTCPDAVRLSRVLRLQGGICGDFAKAAMALFEANGLAARRILTSRLGGSPRDTHETTEVWIPELGRWVVVDATFVGYWTVGGRPASAQDMKLAALSGRRPRFRSTGAPNATPKPNTYYIEPIRLFRHIAIARPDGRVFEVTDGSSRFNIAHGHRVRPQVASLSPNDAALAPRIEAAAVPGARAVVVRAVPNGTAWEHLQVSTNGDPNAAARVLRGLPNRLKDGTLKLRDKKGRLRNWAVYGGEQVKPGVDASETPPRPFLRCSGDGGVSQTTTLTGGGVYAVSVVSRRVRGSYNVAVQVSSPGRVAKPSADSWSKPFRRGTGWQTTTAVLWTQGKVAVVAVGGNGPAVFDVASVKLVSLREPARPKPKPRGLLRPCGGR